MSDFYDWLTNINSIDFKDKSVAIVGGSDISKQYAIALSRLGVEDILVMAKTGSYISEYCKENTIELKTGGFETNLPKINKKDLVIIAPPIQDTLHAAKIAIENGQDNLLIEKPGSLYPKELEDFTERGSKIKVAYNRLVYPNLHKLKELCDNEGGVTSCRFTFTERLSTMDFKKDIPLVYERWGISNSLHVITMAFEIIGLPKEMQCFQYGNLSWHPSGSTFVGVGISEKEIPFTYNADWGSGGRWGIEVNTEENSYQLIPLEDIFACPRDKSDWARVEFKKSFDDVKQGMAEEIALMLDQTNNYKDKLPSLKQSANFNRIAEKIFNYK